MNKFYTYLSGIIFIGIGIFSFLGFNIPSKISGLIKYSFEYAISSIFIGLFFLMYGYYKKEKQKKYTKCPKCKETFNYNKLENGKCKNCEEIDTIDLEEYYIKYPEELEENS